MNLWLTIDIEGAAVWSKEPEMESGLFYSDKGDGSEYAEIDTDEAKKLCGNPALPYKAKVRIEVIK